MSGAQRLAFEVPKDATRVVADGGGEVHDLKIWDGFTYFEQGNAEHGWTLTRSMVRGDMHRFLAEEKALLDAILTLVGPLADGVDIQATLSKKFGDKRVADSHVYDFGAGQLDASQIGLLNVAWAAPTKVPEIFEHFGIDLLSTSFAHDAGQMSVPIKLENLTLYPISYYIRRPNSSEAETGQAKNASFRSMSFVRHPGQNSSIDNQLPQRRR